jgi:hypothetical protein
VNLQHFTDFTEAITAHVALWRGEASGGIYRFDTRSTSAAKGGAE